MDSLSIVIPTLPGRSKGLARTREAYEALTPCKIQWLILEGFDNCGAAWNAGAEKATGEILHMGSDDLWPMTDGWLSAAISILGEGSVPLGKIHHVELDGSLHIFGGDFPRVPICKRAWWKAVPPIHYYSDNAFGDLMAWDGHDPAPAPGFDFHHAPEMIERIDTPDRVASDHALYLEWQARERL